MRYLPIILVIFLAGCGENTRQPLENARELVILTRIGETTYRMDGMHGASGFDYDLAQSFAAELGLTARFVVAADDAEIMQRLKRGEAHMAAAWLTPGETPETPVSIPYLESYNILVTHEASLPISRIEQLADKTICVVAGSRQEEALRTLEKEFPGLTIEAKHRRSELDLMASVASQQCESTLVNNAVFDIGNNFYPELQSSFQIGSEKPITWLFFPGVAPDLIEKANAFLERAQTNGELARLKDRYFGHIERLTQADREHFIERMRSVLPLYRDLFQTAQRRTGIDWRLLAALAYQESKWNPLATSPTKVRGMMMLTEETADELRVDNRLDPAQSIRAGAQYLNALREALPPGIGEPDRLWMAIAAYNVGMGHLNAARYIARSKKVDPNSWYAMKKILPLLTNPQYYNRLKAGRGRGGEAVIMTENVRVYADILKRYEPPYNPLSRIADTPAGNSRCPPPCLGYYQDILSGSPR